ncbi:sulfite exporter TauE/SafE family protein [Rhodopirellula sp. JC740]|uniref:Sulfite exporter TauE/SafE family protein n=1 Tax=Rhodopirellula halodulae TaxID=2894198 RepID=A0ABS8ND54_9BACT|nr:sulfite exporter TauE/SafE family protein [Rhodopirellula sp. JC740]MCC9641485.1 sulfite exporter TauE/SafE family protein [Rhodopirellula sp. JC740]
MWMLAGAVLTASLLGSMHCVGMCGPLAIWASGAGEKHSKSRVAMSTSLYHLGRLTTYVMAGLIAGTIGSLVEIGGQTLGVQLAAARLVGTIMMALGLWKLYQIMTAHRRQITGVAPSRMGGLLVRLRPAIFRLPASGRALAVGMLTTLLPCGWLYLFALVAAGTGQTLHGGVVMAAFWLGTVPALTALIAGTQSLSKRFTRLIPAATAATLILTGGYTASGRGFADLSSLSDIKASVDLTGNSNNSAETMQDLTSTPLPCCCAEGIPCETNEE